MKTYRLILAYDGAPFHGFARQPDLPTVQGTVEEALSRVLGTETLTVGAGRTDAGVHALAQVMSFRSDRVQDPFELLRRLNALCGPQIAVIELQEAPEGFDARFSAEARTYEYAILTREIHDPFARHTTWHHPKHLDADLMAKGAQSLLGEHAFDAFGRVEEGKNPVRRVEAIDIEHDGDLITIRVTANSFLQQMVRSIVGTLVQVGIGRFHPDDVGRILHSRDRAQAGPVAPPHGLFLVSVGYPEELV
ncbi:MAG: tRNA pseudouridine(38-40) synthase TruA [Actinomycetota bacterium]